MFFWKTEGRSFTDNLISFGLLTFPGYTAGTIVTVNVEPKSSVRMSTKCRDKVFDCYIEVYSIFTTDTLPHFFYTVR